MDLINVNSLKMTQKMQSFLDMGTLQQNNGEFEGSDLGSGIAMQRKKKRNRSAANIHGNSSYSYEHTAQQSPADKLNQPSRFRQGGIIVGRFPDSISSPTPPQQ